MEILPNTVPFNRNKFGNRWISILVFLMVCLYTEVYADSNPEPSPAGPKYTRSEAVYSLPIIEMLRHDQVKTPFPQELDDGRPVILNFIFTTCSAICPMLSGVLSGVQNKLGDEMQGMHLVSISIDPEYDNAERLKEYAAKFKAKPQWQFYSGSVDNVKTLQKAFDAYRGDKMNHSATTYLRAAPGKPWVRLDGFLSSDDIIAEYHRLKSSHSSNTGGG